MICNKCGSTVEDEAVFCAECGEKIEKEQYQNNAAFSSLPETVGNDSNVNSAIPSSKGSKKAKPIIIAIIVIVVIAIIPIGLQVIQEILRDKNGNTSNSSTNSPLVTPISITNLTSYGNYDISIEFKNTSEKDIAYISFDVYFYDRMGGALMTSWGEKYLKLDYTGPLYSGTTDSGYWDWLSIPTGTSVIFPKKVIVTFTDDEKVEFNGIHYYKSDDFYGGELKDEYR